MSKFPEPQGSSPDLSSILHSELGAPSWFLSFSLLNFLLLVSSEGASWLPPQPCLWMLLWQDSCLLIPKTFPCCCLRRPSPAPWNQGFCYVLCSRLIRSACWEDSVNTPWSCQTFSPAYSTSHCRSPASQPETWDDFYLFQVGSYSKYSYFKNSSAASPHFKCVSGNVFTEVSSTSTAWVSLPCSHLSHPEEAFYFLQPRCILQLELHCTQSTL